MLQFNPYMRLSAKEILANPYFNDIRIPMNEESSPSKFKFDIDQADSFDYDTGKSPKFTKLDYLTNIVNIIKEERNYRLSLLECPNMY